MQHGTARCDGTRWVIECNGTHLRCAASCCSWKIDRVDTNWASGSYSSIAVDGAGSPHISYYDYTNRDPKYAWWTGEQWLVYVVDTLGEAGQDTSIALDADDVVYISYRADAGLSLAVLAPQP